MSSIVKGAVNIVKKPFELVGKAIGSLMPKPPKLPPMPQMPQLPPMPQFHMPSFQMPTFQFPEMPSFKSPGVQQAGQRVVRTANKAAGRKASVKTSPLGASEDEELGLSVTSKGSTFGSKGGIRKKTLGGF